MLSKNLKKGTYDNKIAELPNNIDDSDIIVLYNGSNIVHYAFVYRDDNKNEWWTVSGGMFGKVETAPLQKILDSKQWTTYTYYNT